MPGRCSVRRGFSDRGSRSKGNGPVSYRSFKHLLGETSLERKCRFIFGLGILVLVSGSFFWYGQKTESLVLKQTTQTARMLVNDAAAEHPYQVAWATRTSSRSSNASRAISSRSDDLPNYEARVLNPYKLQGSRASSPPTSSSATQLARFLQAAQQNDRRKAGERRREVDAFADGTPIMGETITATARRNISTSRPSSSSRPA